jgi:hypothetical protein
MFFLIAGLISSVGPGAISSVALVVPLAMVIGKRVGIPPFLTALMVANGANAGNLSPVSSVGVIVNTSMASVGLGGHEAKVFLANLLAHVAVAIGAFLLFGGRRLEGRVESPAEETSVPSLSRAHWATLAVVLLWILGVLVFRLSLGLSAFVGAALLIGTRAVDEGAAIRRTPWGVIVMVCGVTMLVSLLEVTGGMDLFSSLLSRLATPGSVNGVIAFVTGTISTYSSTSGVVLPAFLPTVPGLVRELGGGDPVAVSLSINVGSSLVDVSPLSTLGALCVAALPDDDGGAPACSSGGFCYGGFRCRWLGRSSRSFSLVHWRGSSAQRSGVSGSGPLDQDGVPTFLAETANDDMDSFHGRAGFNDALSISCGPAVVTLVVFRSAGALVSPHALARLHAPGSGPRGPTRNRMGSDGSRSGSGIS